VQWHKTIGTLRTTHIIPPPPLTLCRAFPGLHHCGTSFFGLSSKKQLRCKISIHPTNAIVNQKKLFNK
jgi:hypothetical protein